MSLDRSCIIFFLLSVFLSRLDCSLATLSFNLNDRNAHRGWNNKPNHNTHAAPLRSSDVIEGSCQSPLPANADNLNLTWAFEPRIWYQPVASRFGYAGYAEILLGRSAKNIYELENMCAILAAMANGKFILSGYGSLYFQNCALDPTDTNTISCEEDGGSFHVDVLPLATEQVHIVLTNNKDYMLIVRCVNGKYKDYLMLTTTPFIPTGVDREAVCHKLKELGFNLLWVMKLPCHLNSYGLHGRSDEFTEERFIHRGSFSNPNNPLNYCAPFL